MTGIAEALAAHQAGDVGRAEHLYRQLIAAGRDLSDANHFLGVLQFQRGHLEEAKELIGRALKINPKDDNAHHHHGMVLSTLKQHEDALASFEQAVALNPNNPKAHKSCGVALLSLNRYGEALASFDAAIALDPTFAAPHYGRATVLRKQRLFDLAHASYDRTLALKPDNLAIVWYNRAVTLAFLNRHDEAVACYDKAIAARPEFAEAYFGKGLVKLSLGDYAEGWRLYEWRWKKVDYAPRAQHFDRPPWRNDADLSGKTLLAYAEQGFGDTIQFVRYLEFFKDRNCRVMLAVHTALAPLMRENGIEVIECNDTILPVKTFPPFDHHCSLLDMPLAFGTTLDTIPASIPYLEAPRDEITAWGVLLGERTKPRIGLAWSGHPTHKNDLGRSIRLETLLPLMVDRCEWFSLQKLVREYDRDALINSPLRDVSKQLNDFADTAALIYHLDVVITVDTSIAHLAGALGKPVWIMLPFSADFRWLRDRDDSPWYPTAKLFRQTTDGAWAEVFERVLSELASGLPGQGRLAEQP
jgi:tetratricopeptide (TPR) repeat protein